MRLKPLPYLVLVMLFAGPAAADAIGDRAADLAGIDARLTTGTRFERIAALESIIDSRDLTRVQLAIKTALQSDDADLRAVALRGYFLFADRIVVTRTAPEAARAEIENLVGRMKFENDPGTKLAPFAEKFRTSTIALKDYDFSTGKGSTNTYGAVSGFRPFAINAENVSFQVGSRLNGNNTPYADCFYDLRLDGGILRGPINCGPETPVGSVAEIRLY